MSHATDQLTHTHKHTRTHARTHARTRALKHSPIDRYLEAAHLAILAGSSLFVHGGITARAAGFLPHAADTDRRLPVTDWVLL